MLEVVGADAAVLVADATELEEKNARMPLAGEGSRTVSRGDGEREFFLPLGGGTGEMSRAAMLVVAAFFGGGAGNRSRGEIEPSLTEIEEEEKLS